MATQTLSSVAEVLAELEKLPGEKRFIIAVDGRGGAGKSTFARNLVAAIPGAVHIEHDWFHLPKSQVSPEQRFDHNRLLQQVIQPFLAGRRSFSFPRYNWGYLAGIEDGFASEPIEICGADALVIEGCETLYSTLCSHYRLRIWIDTDPAESLRRGVQRDIQDYKLDPTRVHDCWREWVAREEEGLRRDDRRGRADLLFEGKG